MSQFPTPNQPYFPGISYNPSFFTSSSGISLNYATNNFLQRTGTNPTSIATQTTFSGSINVSSLTTTTDSTIGGNLTVSNNLKANRGTIQGALTVQDKLLTTSTVSSLDYQSGSVIISGGVGIAKDVFTNGSIFTNGNVSIGVGINPSLYGLDVSGNIHTNKNLYALGNVGIGTTTPGYVLDVSGTASFSDNTIMSKNLTVSGSTVLHSDTTIYGNTQIYNDLIVYGKGRIFNDTIINGNVLFYSPLIESYGEIIIYNVLTVYDISCLGTIHSGLNVFVDGQLGVATTTPVYDLDVSGVINTNNNLYVNGYCGIGTTTPERELDVSGTVQTIDIGMLNGGKIYAKNNTGTYMEIMVPCWNDNTTYMSYAPGGMNIRNNSFVSTMYLNNSNQVGIKTTTPAYTLDVSGEIQTNANFRMPNSGIIYAKNVAGTYLPIFFPCWLDNITYLNYGSAGMNIRNSSSVNTMFFNNSNQVGIKTTTPAYTLDVSGEIQTNANFRMPNSGIIYAKNTSGTYINVLTPCSSDNITYLSHGSAGYNIRNSSSVNTMFFNNSNQVGIRTTTPVYPLDVSGIINTNTSIQSPIYNFNYSTVPTLTSASSGYSNTATYTSLPITLASSSAYAITFTSLPIGVYLIQGYAIGTFITTAITNIKLGLNTSAVAPTANNFTQQILPILSTTQVQSISYSYYLSNTAVTTYYIVFATGASFGASSVTGFTASFIRIA